MGPRAAGPANSVRIGLAYKSWAHAMLFSMPEEGSTTRHGGAFHELSIAGGGVKT